MSSLNRSQRAIHIFQQALDLPPADQASFIQQACAGHPVLLLEVQQLLHSHRETAGFSQAVDNQIAAVAGTIVEAGVSEAMKLIGKQVNGRYLIDSVLGSGGMGLVYRARDQQVHWRPVVVKVLLETSAQNEWVLRKFIHESEALARIDHPNVVKVLDRGEFEHQPFLVMEFIKGQPLTTRLKAGPLPLPEVAVIVHQICQALEAAHAAGIVHRDLKPDNIMVWQRQDGLPEIKLIDFGVARLVEPQSAEKTFIPVPVGTLPYMAAEIINGDGATVASDIYSLGVIVYEMVTGLRPFRVETATQYASLVQYWNLQRAGDFPKPVDLRPDLPSAAQQVILKALAFQPIDRYGSVVVFERELLMALPSAVGYQMRQTTSAPLDTSHQSERLISTAPECPQGTPAVHPAVLSETLPGVVGSPGNSLTSSRTAVPPSSSQGQIPTLVSQPPGVFSPSSPLDATLASPHLPSCQPPGGMWSALPDPAITPLVKQQGHTWIWLSLGLIIMAGLAGWIGLVIMSQKENLTPNPSTAGLEPSTPTRKILPFEGTLSLKRKSTQKIENFQLDAPEKTMDCETGDELRLSVKPLKTGYIYILNESPSLNQDVLPNYIILFPSVYDNNGSARFESGHPIDLPAATASHGLELGADKGTEKLWLVWSPESIAEFETVKTLANQKEQGIIRKKEQIEAVTKALTRQHRQATIHCIKLEHQ